MPGGLPSVPPSMSQFPSGNDAENRRRIMSTTGDVVKSGTADAMKRKTATRQNIGSAYQSMMGQPSSPQDHAANNVQHPSGNRGIADSTLSMFPPLNTPNSGAYQDDY